jgi:glutathione synthase/RimK-type ligase-like ATP-grasp enzyme
MTTANEKRNLAERCRVVNGSPSGWAFEPLARHLSSLLEISVSETPADFNYLLYSEGADHLPGSQLFIPLEGIRLAADKRRLAVVFCQQQVPTPTTHLFDTFAGATQFMLGHSASRWCLKYPTSCGANGHRLLTAGMPEPPNWPRPFVVQEFIELERPEVYRTYCAGGEIFGWIARRFPEGGKVSLWVAHAQGARYVKVADSPPREALEAARRALAASQLLSSFGCVDMLRRLNGEWLVLETGTDGLFNHVDRDFGDASLAIELDERLAKAFWAAAEIALRE